MKLRFRPVPPNRADGTMLPAALVAVLALMAIVQLAITDPVELPPPGPIGVGAPLPLVRDPQIRGVPGLILSRPIFAPPASALADAGEGGEGVAPADPLGGAAILGMVGVGRARYAMVREGGHLRRVSVGGNVAGWRIVALGQDGALLARGTERLRRDYGAGTSGEGNDASSAADDTSSEDQQ